MPTEAQAAPTAAETEQVIQDTARQVVRGASPPCPPDLVPDRTAVYKPFVGVDWHQDDEGKWHATAYAIGVDGQRRYTRPDHRGHGDPLPLDVHLAELCRHPVVGKRLAWSSTPSHL